MNRHTHGQARLNKGTYVLSAIFFLVVPALLCSAAWAQNGPHFVKDRFIVTFKAEAGDPDQASDGLARAHGFRLLNVYRYALQGMAIEIPEPAQQHVLDALRQNPNVDSIVQDRIITLTAAQTVPKGVMRVGVQGIPSPANAGAQVRVAIMDTGIDLTHPDLLDNIDTSLSKDCVSTKPCVPGGDDVYGHGTSVAGVVAAVNNTSDLVGVAPAARLVSVRIFDSAGKTTTTDVLAGIDYLRWLNLSGTPVHVVNMSFMDYCKDNVSGAYISCGSDPDVAPQHTAIQNLVASGTTVVAAAGNDSINTDWVWPAGFSETVAVSALADSNGLPGGGGPSVCLTYLLPGWCLQSVPDDSFATFSNFGARVDVIAPGADELLLQNGGGTRRASGTSFAAPHAVGVAAIFISDRLAQLPAPATVKQALIQTGECYEINSTGNVFHGKTGCTQIWPGDKDSFAEPLVRADTVTSFEEDTTSVPAAPSNLTATAFSSSQINLAWSDNSTNEVGFKIERCEVSNCSDSNFALVTTVISDVTTYRDTGLMASTAYTYRVRAYNAVGDSDYSNTASATTQSAPQVPAAPGGLAATAASSSQINLTWTDNSNNETGFKIERCTGTGCSNFMQIATVGAGTTSYSNTGLAANTSYSYRVRAYNSVGDSGYSNTATATTQSAPAIPAAPGNLAATAASSTQINLSWTDNSGNETGFKIERCKGSTCTGFTQIATVGANVTSYSNTRLSRNTTYRYRVRAYNAAGNSGYSNIAAATTLR